MVFLLDFHDKTGLEMALGRKVGDFLTESEWKEMKVRIEQMAFSEPGADQDAERLANFYLRIVRYFSVG